MTVSLTQSEANAKLSQIEDARNRAKSTLQQIEDAQSQMLGTGWQGQSASKYGNVSQTQRDDINAVITNLDHIVNTASSHIRSLVTSDNG